MWASMAFSKLSQQPRLPPTLILYTGLLHSHAVCWIERTNGSELGSALLHLWSVHCTHVNKPLCWLLCSLTPNQINLWPLCMQVWDAASGGTSESWITFVQPLHSAGNAKFVKPPNRRQILSWMNMFQLSCTLAKEGFLESLRGKDLMWWSYSPSPALTSTKLSIKAS